MKFYIKDNISIFSDSYDNIIKNLILNKKSSTLIDNIIRHKTFNDNSSNESEYLPIGMKRNKISKIRNVVKYDFELSDEYYTLEEKSYFYIYN